MLIPLCVEKDIANLEKDLENNRKIKCSGLRQMQENLVLILLAGANEQLSIKLNKQVIKQLINYPEITSI